MRRSLSGRRQLLPICVAPPVSHRRTTQGSQPRLAGCHIRAAATMPRLGWAMRSEAYGQIFLGFLPIENVLGSAESNW